MDNYARDLQRMLKSLRLACGYTQDAVASALEITRPAYSCYELGRSLPNVITLKKLAVIFDVPPEAFLYPECFEDVSTLRQRVPKIIKTPPHHLSELSIDEKELIARYRLSRVSRD